jgi:hypothetical protein
MKSQKKVTNKQASGYDFTITIHFPVIIISKPQKKCSQSTDSAITAYWSGNFKTHCACMGI